jgi:pyruvate ferredoxin oxidoreductase alpha subunit
VLVCQDGFTITHSAEPVSTLSDDSVRLFMHEYQIPQSVLDVAHPASQGPFAMPDYYFELRHQQLAAMRSALDVFDEVAWEYALLSGRRYRVLEPYALYGADHVVVCLGSTAGTVKDAVDELRREGLPVGLLEVRSFRPFPVADVRGLLGCRRIVSVLDRADSPGGAAPLFADVATALRQTAVELRSHVYGLGGRDLHPEDVRVVFADASPLSYLGLRGMPCPV